jgi:hypothetical protein
MPERASTTHVLLDNELIVYRRPRSRVWQCRYKVDSTWQRATTKQRDLAKAKSNRKLTALGTKLCEYFAYRADLLDNFVQPRLMDAERAEAVYNDLKAKLKPKLAATMNKQKGDKAKVAYLTAIVNMLIESVVGHEGFNPDPRQLTTFTRNSMPLRTLSRRVDGALPGVVNPVAIWEIKEYYYTTTFGSRVADGVYETLLDGMELEEMQEHEGRHVEHMLALDAHYTWWTCGRSYLCRIVDMLNMGYVDEVLFGYEVVERLPALATEWLALAKANIGEEPQIKGEVAVDQGAVQQNLL